MPRSVYFHIGAGKTGTSAIQVALVRNRQLLESHGFLYPAGETDRSAELGLTTSGNAERFAGLLKADTASGVREVRADIVRTLKKHPDHSLIYSSELFVGCPMERFAELAGAVRAAGADVRVIYYVRHILDFAVSRYAQQVKRGGSTESFEAYIGRYKSNFSSVARGFSGVVGRDNMILRLYDRERPRLAAGFFEIFLGPEKADWNLSLVAAPVNRSLSLEQVHIMLFVNALATRIGKRIPAALLAEIADALPDPAGGEPQKFVVTPDELAALRQRNADVVADINNFAGNAFTLDFVGDGVTVGARPAHQWSGRDRIFLRALTALVEIVRRPGRRAWQR